jgi:hypothetical protein
MAGCELAMLEQQSRAMFDIPWYIKEMDHG